MRLIRKHLYTAVAISSLALLSATAQAAGTVTGTIKANITLTDACTVNGLGSGEFGVLSFGAHSALFAEADAEVLNGVGAIEIVCSPGVTPTFKITGSANNTAPGDHSYAMKKSDSEHYVGYDLFTDAGRTAPYTEAGITLEPFTDAGTSQTITLYGTAHGDPGKLPAGDYEDTLNVQISW